MFAAIVPLFRRQYCFSDTALGILLGPAFAITYGFAAIAFGRSADRRSPHQLMIAGLATLTLALAIIAASDRFVLFLLGQILLGLGQAAFVPAAMLMIVHNSVAYRHGPPPLSLFTGASALGRSTGFMMAGGVLGLVTALWPVPRFDGWRILPLVAILIHGIVIILCLRFVPDRSLVEATSTTKADGGRLKGALIPLFVAAFAPILIGHSLAAWMPSLLVRMRGFEVAEAASFFGGILLVMGFAGQVAGGLATKRMVWVARHPLIANATCLVLTVPLLTLATRAQQTSLIVTSLGGVLLLVGIAAFIALQAVQAAATATRRGETTGMFLALVTLVGAGGGPLLIGLLSDSTLTAANGQGLGTALVLVGASGALFNVVIALATTLHHARLATA